MKRFTLFFVLAFSICSFVAFTPGGDEETAEIDWISFTEAVERNEKDQRPMMIDVYTDWCGWCKRMDATTMKNPVIVKYINENFHAVKLDGEHKEDIKFGDTVYKFVPNGRRGYHELPANLMQGKMSYPTLVFLTSDYKVLQSIPGYQDAKSLERIAKFLGDKKYETTKWEDYNKETTFEIN